MTLRRRAAAAPAWPRAGATARPGRRVGGDDPGRRDRPDRHPADRAHPRALRRALRRARVHRPPSRPGPSAAATARPPTPSATPPRRPAPRRSAPAFARACTGATSAVDNRPSGQPLLRLTGGAAARLAALTPAGMTRADRSQPDRRAAVRPCRGDHQRGRRTQRRRPRAVMPVRRFALRAANALVSVRA